MQHYIRIVTGDLISKIKDDQLHYTPAELIAAGFPDFLVQRIRLELQRNLADSVSLPDSDWADMQADPVQDAWDNFLEAIHAEIRVPESYLQSVVENAVEDILELLAEPEKFTLDTLFRQEQQVSILEMHARRPWIVLNGHLADSIIRYMQRRKMQTMERKKAANIIRQIDQHLASGYTPLKWAQALDVCFTLMGQRVPSSLIARYFADKGLTDISQRMEAADEELSRSRLIEFLSVPNLNWDTDEDDFNDTVSVPIVPATPADEESDDENISLLSGYQKSSPVETEDVFYESDEQLEHEDSEDWSAQPAQDDDSEEQTVPLFQAAIPDDEHTIDDPFGLGESENDKESPASVLNQFMADIEEVPETDTEPVTASDSLFARFNTNEVDDIDDDIESETESDDDLLETFSPINENNDEEFEPFQNPAPEKDETEDSDEDADDAPIPIWQRFISPDYEDDSASADSMANTLGMAHNDEDEQEEIQAPRIVTKNNHPQLSGKARQLLDQLDTSAPLFVDQLFDGNIHRFYETLNKLVTFDRWQDAGKYLTRDVFVPQGIDMYAGEAILFVDLVQQYFENQS